MEENQEFEELISVARAREAQEFEKLINAARRQGNPVITDMRKKVVPADATKAREPIVLLALPTASTGTEAEAGLSLHAALTSSLGGGCGVMDMLIKSQGSMEIVLPAELAPLAPILRQIAAFEKQALGDSHVFKSRNMFLLIDLRDVVPGQPQRNMGWHYDGLNVNPKGTFSNTDMVSAYGYTNVLPSFF